MKMLLAGATSFAFELCGGHAIQFLKIQKQTTGLPYATITRQITQTKGMVGLLDGFLPWGAFIAVGKGAVFGLGHAGSMYALRGTIRNDAKPLSLSEPAAQIISGGVGGFFQGLAANPLLLLNTRVMTNAKFRNEKEMLSTSTSSFRLASEIIRTEGPMALMKGAHILAGKRVLDWTSRFFFVVIVEEAIKRRTQESQLTFAQKSMASIAGGVLSCAVTIPLDVMVATVQTHTKAGQKVRLLGTGSSILQSGGIGALVAFSTRGFVARATHVGLATLLMKTITSKLYELMQSKKLTTDRRLSDKLSV
ncbi:hypothetical protein SARC_05537 [Sphaeroforma arctica JP610]|uniref:Mitochondrial carrier protein n=1 Tax=Sphaeroforma arctica JP610 TaxID=667725 RepID=A0A0L0G008_9EUKA|nr:hypothetical protein SARC_05537 [Sphaeroforma arctica JP610]KNC82179.1 hypothetical protein SARC_05537 [Sphaeroforma arctica JP610]|eukprot:XP_014156081.1 hypothetical protein SARC_05537 [Sphaeroforma arctica JP610]